MPYKAHSDRKRTQALYRQRVNKEARAEIVAVLGGKCLRCGFNDHRALAIDHVHGGGTAQRRQFGGNYYNRVRQIILSGSQDYQLLCFNCNEIKKHEQQELKNKIHFINAG